MRDPVPGNAAERPRPEEMAAAVAAIERFVRDTGERGASAASVAGGTEPDARAE